MKNLQLVGLLVAVFSLGACSHRPSAPSASSPQPSHTKPTKHLGNIDPAVLSIHDKLVAQHADWHGVPHRWGGQSKSGVDCSALVQLTYQQHFSLQLPRTTQEQSSVGTAVSKQQLQAGDLVFFKTGRNQRHVGMMLDSQRFLHASYSKGVIISELSNPYWRKNYWRARRVL
ncbi:NlpC/P60 family protein [Aliagarivorans marinus]|uniref:NlpC/P60 family protein n=1 Tax=Aliagarivorans marinus TaxID=561965 RepID=UPI000552CA75|nr:NlpC/P60 family protein [Aliagarivorans marinus]